MNIKIGIITSSDKGYSGERKDKSGPKIKQLVEAKGYSVIKMTILPDDIKMLSEELIFMADELKCDIILTTGGTGFSPRDITPEATLSVIERRAEGIVQAMRQESLKITPRAMLSRAEAGLRGKTLIINLPGSEKAAAECLSVVIDVFEHAVEILKGDAGDCAR